MVNYCCVVGCNRNSKNDSLRFYGLPKEEERLKEWLQIAGRNDLLEKLNDGLEPPKWTRICSRHFEPVFIKTKILRIDAIPTRFLPGVANDDESEEIETCNSTFPNLACNSCQGPIVGFCYKCITCKDYDLCVNCERLQVHPKHYMIRIPKPVKFTEADNIVKKWQQRFEEEQDSSDDEPITKYVTNYDSGIDLSEDIKSKICEEITKVLKIPKTKTIVTNKKQATKRVETSSRKRSNHNEVPSKKQKQNEEQNTPHIEVAFADVNDSNVGLYVKPEGSSYEPNDGDSGEPPIKMSDLVIFD